MEAGDVVEADVVAVVLAAGGGRRLGGRPKALRRRAESADCDVVVNQDWETGMGSSLRAALAAAPGPAAAVGDRGARDFLARHEVVSVPCYGSLADIDIPGDLKLL